MAVLAAVAHAVPDGARPRPPPARRRRPDGRHAARRDLGAVRLERARARREAWSWVPGSPRWPSSPWRWCWWSTAWSRPGGCRGCGEVSIDGLGLDGLRVVVLTDTHFGPIDRARWSARVVEVVNGLRPDLVVHLGDLADGSVARRGPQVAPLGDVRAPAVLHPGQPRALRRRGAVDRAHARARLAAAGQRAPADRRQAGARGRRRPHRGARPRRRAGRAPTPRKPVLLLAHQPSQVVAAAAAGVALQLSGHTHGGQIWPFHYPRAHQPARAGRAQPARRAHPALRQPGHRVLGSTAAGVRAQRDHRADAAAPRPARRGRACWAARPRRSSTSPPPPRARPARGPARWRPPC